MNIVTIFPVQSPVLRNKLIFIKHQCPDCGGELHDDGCGHCMFHTHEALESA